MQLAIELPDELGQELMKKENVELFVQEAIRKMLQYESALKSEQKADIHLPITQSLLGILKGCDIDEEDYKRHLEEKELPTDIIIPAKITLTEKSMSQIIDPLKNPPQPTQALTNLMSDD